jgi:hypothetical protein
MADRDFEPLQGLNLEQKVICGSFEPNGAGTQDSLAIGTTTAEVLYTAVAYGPSGVSVAQVTAGVSTPLSVVVNVNTKTITVNLATNSSSVATSTAAQVVTAVNANTFAAALVVASDLSGGGGTAVAAAVAPLTGHSGGVPLAITGAGFTVLYAGTGTYTLKFNDQYMRSLAQWADLSLATPTDQIAQVGTFNVTDQGTLPQQAVITTLSSATGSAADVAAAAGNRVSFSFEMQNTAAPPTHD